MTFKSCKCGNPRRLNQRNCKSCHATNMRNNRKNHPQHYGYKQKARAIAGVYYRRGKIIKTPCVKCGDPKSQMHHPNYFYVLDVIWLCRKCHLETHFTQKSQDL